MRPVTPGGEVGPGDRAVIAGQLDRKPRDLTGVAVRCPFGHPAVAESAPVLSDGSPNPTLLYVTCPTLDAAISRAEGAGAVRKLRATCREDGALGSLLEQITSLYRERREVLYQRWVGESEHDPRLAAGIGGPGGPETASCLHAYAAAMLAVTHGWLKPKRPDAVAAVVEAWSRFLPPVDDCWCTDRRCSKWQAGERRAAIDVGTISVRLLVADVIEGHPWTLARRAEITRLGEGLAPGGALGEAARSRTAAVVKGFLAQAVEHGVTRTVVAGTSAAREAADGQEFVESLGDGPGVRALVLSGEQEAGLAYAGACLETPGEPLVLDVGGGSTELIVRSATGEILAVSLPLGASRATEHWIETDPPADAELDQVVREATKMFAGVRKDFALSEGSSNKRPLVGVAGTVTTLAALDADLQEYDPEVIHLRELTREQTAAVLARLAVMTTEERAALPCVQAGRAPVIVAGAAVVLAAMDTLGYESLTVSERDLLDGLVLGDDLG